MSAGLWIYFLSLHSDVCEILGTSNNPDSYIAKGFPLSFIYIHWKSGVTSCTQSFLLGHYSLYTEVIVGCIHGVLVNFNLRIECDIISIGFLQI